jgi:hypothetical protein
MKLSMHKPTVHQLILDKLRIDLDIAERAAQTAYETATHEENIAENKYDTLGLEASYLAAGQAKRGRGNPSFTDAVPEPDIAPV